MTSRTARHHSRALALLAVLAPMSFGTCAADDVGRLSWGAFGSLGAVYHDSDGIEYRRNWEQPSGAKAGEVELGTDSVLGGQVTAQLLPLADLTVQAVSRLHSDNSWSPQLTRAFLRLEPDEAVMIRLGRVGLESQTDAESRYIGYSYLSIRPAQELLAVIPVDYIDGGDIRYSRPIAHGVGTIKAMYGTTRGKLFANGSEASLGETTTHAIILGHESEYWRGRVYGGVSRLRDNGSVQALIDTLNAVAAPQAVAAADALDHRGARVGFHGIDLDLSDGPLRLQASYLKTSAHRTEVLLPSARTYALLAGYRIDQVTPYVQYGRAMRSRVHLTPPGLGLLDTAIETAIAGTLVDQHTVGVGARIDVSARAALKLQVDRIRARYSPLILDPAQASGAPKSLTLFSASLDFAF